ncbi:hypothetical protein JCM19297_303 [Nonlabens ulvanivorans]|nr:P-loop NTPase fold protein [Nonlabens ulvanivorans]GAK89681.1 hypothetical protein JCM19297_303 [Nonlabens ulvanivorans]
MLFGGYGKSSFLHRFKNKFERDNPREIVFWYRIWKNKGSNAIIENFFEELKHQLKPYSGEIADDINNYVESILSLSHSEIQKIASVGKAIISDKETLENHFQGINHSIAKIDRQIIILLDDLDRLEDSEIMNTLKLIRTLSDFNNIIFIAGYDRQYITETIDASKSNYLDKIFNVEINLLPFDSELIVSELEIEVNKIFVDQLGINDNNNFNEAFKNLFKDLTLKGEDISLDDMFKENAGQNCQSNYVLKYQDFLLTYRDVKRFINEFKFNFSFLSNQADVIPQEYILLKLLTYKFRELNNLLFANLDYYLKRDNKDLGNDGIISFGSDYRSNIYIYNSESQKKLRDKLKNIDDDHFNIINAVMCRLFGEKSINFYQSNQNCISKIYYTDLYLRNNILSGNISLSDFQKAFKENQLFQLVQSISFNADKININTANEIKQFIYNVSIDSKKRFLDVIKTINFVFNSSNIYDQLKVLSLLNESYVEYYGYYDQTFIEDLQEVINIPSIGFLDSLFRDMNLDIKRKNSKLDYKSNNINKYDTSNLREKDIEQLMLGKLKFLLEKNVDPELIIQFYYTDVAAIVGDKKIIRSIDFNLLIQNDIHHRFPKYFHSTLFESITKRISDSNGEFFGYEPMFHLAQIFSNQKTVKELIKFPSDIKIFNQYYIEGWHNLLEYLEGIKKQKNYKKEIDDSKLDFSIEFLKQFIKNDYKPLSKNQYDEIWNNLPF